MQIHISRNGSILGEFSLAELEKRVTQRSVLPTDFAWMENMDDWKPLREIVDCKWPADTSAAVMRTATPAGARPKLVF